MFRQSGWESDRFQANAQRERSEILKNGHSGLDLASLRDGNRTAVGGRDDLASGLEGFWCAPTANLKEKT